jgi:hypothetical protein
MAMTLWRFTTRRPGAPLHHAHRWPLWVLVAALLLLAACDPKKSNPPKPETGPLVGHVPSAIFSPD